MSDLSAGIPEHDYIPEADAVPEVVAREPRTARGAVLVGARIVTGIVGVAVAALAIGAATLVPLPSYTSAPPGVVVTPVASAQQRVCPGPVLRLGDASGQQATVISSVGKPTVRHSQTAGRATLAPLRSTDNTSGVAPELLTLPPHSPSSTAAPILSGSQSQSIDSGDLVGFAAAECAEGSADSWLVGGSTVTGRTTLITLSNPSNVVATVNLTIYSEAGPVSAAGAQGITVAPGGQRVLSLAGFAPDVSAPVVRVQSTGGQVIANLQQSVIRTLEPGGVDIVGPSTAPAKITTIPGIVISNGIAVTARQAESGYGDMRSIIRLYVPGTQPAKAEISIVPENGSEAATPVRVVVQPGVVTEVPLDSYPDANYTVTIASDQPLVGAARISTVSATGQSDFAWFASAPSLPSPALISVAPGPNPVLHIENPTAKEAVVTISSPGQSSAKVTIPAGRSVDQPATADTNYTLSGFAALRATVSYSGDAQLGSFPVSPSAPASQPINIYP
ncbi:MAG: hypothetical protein JWM49_3021 [Microbacteriaceae bacterium]|nr:hypothetical protein [Microbacteriaceae bacterium]